MNIAEASIRYRTTTLVLVVLIIGGGILAYEKLGRLEDPEFTIKEAKVYTAYPGASAAEVEKEVTDKIETAIQQLGQLKRVTSVSSPGLSTITVEIKDKYDKSTLPQVWDELRRKVGDVTDLPPGTSQSIVYDDFGDVFGVYIAIYGDGFTYAELKEYVKVLRRELLLVQDVAKIVLYGVQQEVVYVEISRAKLGQLGISPEAVYGSLTGQNLVATAGHVNVDNIYVRIEPNGQFETVEEIGDLLILQDDSESTKVYLKDIARVYRDYEEPPSTIMHLNGRPAIGLAVSTVEGGNVVTMGNALRDRFIQLEKETPVGIELGLIAVQSASVTTAINNFIVSLGQAIIIVVGVLMIAMGLRSGILIGGILLLTVLGTFIVMQMQGIMLERISLGALIIALGMLVDNAIVVVEGILINLQKGMGRIEAASKIVGQTIWPLLGATVVAVLAFAAIGASQDSTGEYCRSLFYVIMISLMLSWLLAITVTPLFGVMFLKVKPGAADKDPYGGVIFTLYRGFLTMCVNQRWLTVLVLVAMMILGVWGFGFVEQSFFPDATRPQFMVHYWLPQGTYIERTEEDLKRLQEDILEIEGVDSVAGFVGAGATRFLLTYSPEDANSAYGMVLVTVDDYKQIPELRKKVQDILDADYPDALAYSRQFALGPGEAQKIQVRFRGPDPVVLRRLSDQAMAILDANPNIVDKMTDWRDRVPMVRPLLAETQARNAGIVRANVCEALNRAFVGEQIGQYREGDELLPIVARSPEEERYDVDNLHDIQIWSDVAHKAIPIGQVILGFETVSEETLIWRRDRLPTITVKCDPKEGTAAAAFGPIMKQFTEEIKVPIGYEMQWGGEYEDSADAQAGLAARMPITVLMMILIVIILFNAIRDPLVIFLTVPLAIIGVTVGLLITRQPFGFMALLGMLSLSGMLIKNAIVLIDEIRTLRKEGTDAYTAVIQAGVSRARPVSMAAVTTVLGMIPLLADAFFVSMAVTIMFGLSFATILTLVVVPVLYSIFFNVKKVKTVEVDA
jgi:multidrug efflux pump subunit AcrB